MTAKKPYTSKPKHKKKKKYPEHHSSIKTWHRIGAIILVIAIIMSLVTMYGF